MRLSLQIPFEARRLALALRLGLATIQLRVGPGFPISTDDPKLREAKAAARELRKLKLTVGALGFYRNLLDPDGEVAREDRARMARVLEMAEIFRAPVVGVFAGRDPGHSIEEAIGPWAECWKPLVRQARRRGVRIAFENCTMFRGYPNRGINLSHTPDAYRQMFEAIPDNTIGIEFDPSHLVKQHIDPVGFIKQFPDRIYHVHAKDHERLSAMEQQHGCFDVRASRDRFPGRGQVAFYNIIDELRHQGYKGPITIEGEKDPDYPREKDLFTGLRHSVKFLGILLAS